MIKLYTAVATRSDLIELQFQSLKKHLQGEFEFTVFNNSQYEDVYKSISNECQRLGLKCIDVARDDELVRRLQMYEPRFPLFRISGQYSEPGVGNEYSLCWAWEKHIAPRGGLAAWMHSDVFLIADFNPSAFLEDYDLCYVPQCRPGIREYMWDGLALFNLDRLPEAGSLCWMGGFLAPNVAGDTGTVTSLYLDKHVALKIFHIGANRMEDNLSVEGSRPFHEILSFRGKPAFLHYMSGTNWDNQTAEYHRKKTEWLRNVIHQS